MRPAAPSRVSALERGVFCQLSAPRHLLKYQAEAAVRHASPAAASATLMGSASMRWLSYWYSRRRALKAVSRAVHRGGQAWDREDLYDRGTLR